MELIESKKDHIFMEKHFGPRKENKYGNTLELFKGEEDQMFYHVYEYNPPAGPINIAVLCSDDYNYFPQNMMILSTTEEKVLKLSTEYKNMNKLLLTVDTKNYKSNILLIVNDQVTNFPWVYKALYTSLMKDTGFECSKVGRVGPVKASLVSDEPTDTSVWLKKIHVRVQEKNLWNLKEHIKGIISNCM
jgi:hypothetical protein